MALHVEGRKAGLRRNLLGEVMALPNNQRKLPLEPGKTYKVTWKRPDQRRMRIFSATFTGEEPEGFLNFSNGLTLRVWWIVQCNPTNGIPK